MSETEEDIRAIARLKAAEGAGEKRLEDAGKRAGIKYVLDDADPVELRLLQKWFEQLGTNYSLIRGQLSFFKIAEVMCSSEDDPEDAAKCVDDAMREHY